MKPLQQQMRTYRNFIASHYQSKYVEPRTGAIVDSHAIFLTIIDYVHHLETRVSELEKRLGIETPEVPGKDISTSEQHDTP